MKLGFAPLGKDRKLIQVADLYTSALFQAFQPDRYGAIESSYLLALKHQFFRRSSSPLGLGLKIFPDSGMSESPSEWLEMI
jgi:hypothetical protein